VRAAGKTPGYEKRPLKGAKDAYALRKLALAGRRHDPGGLPAVPGRDPRGLKAASLTAAIRRARARPAAGPMWSRHVRRAAHRQAGKRGAREADLECGAPAPLRRGETLGRLRASPPSGRQGLPPCGGSPARADAASPSPCRPERSSRSARNDHARVAGLRQARRTADAESPCAAGCTGGTSYCPAGCSQTREERGPIPRRTSRQGAALRPRRGGLRAPAAAAAKYAAYRPPGAWPQRPCAGAPRGALPSSRLWPAWPVGRWLRPRPAGSAPAPRT
jgi:hypothetical protein